MCLEKGLKHLFVYIGIAIVYLADLNPFPGTHCIIKENGKQLCELQRQVQYKSFFSGSLIGQPPPPPSNSLQAHWFYSNQHTESQTKVVMIVILDLRKRLVALGRPEESL